MGLVGKPQGLSTDPRGRAARRRQAAFHDISFKPAHRYQAAAWLAYTAGYATRTSAGAWSPEAPLGSAGKLTTGAPLWGVVGRDIAAAAGA